MNFNERYHTLGSRRARHISNFRESLSLFAAAAKREKEMRLNLNSPGSSMLQRPIRARSRWKTRTGSLSRCIRYRRVCACARFGAGGHTFNFARPITKSDMHHSEINSQQRRAHVLFVMSRSNSPEREREAEGEGEGEGEEVSEENKPRRGGR